MYQVLLDLKYSSNPMTYLSSSFHAVVLATVIVGWTTEVISNSFPYFYSCLPQFILHSGECCFKSIDYLLLLLLIERYPEFLKIFFDLALLTAFYPSHTAGSFCKVFIPAFKSVWIVFSPRSSVLAPCNFGVLNHVTAPQRNLPWHLSFLLQ